MNGGLFGRAVSTSSPVSWERARERSAPWLIGLLVWIARSLGRRAALAVLWPVTLYFFATAATARRASRELLRAALPQPPRGYASFRHFLTFSTCTLDRVFLLTEKHRDLRVRIHKPPGFSRKAVYSRGGLLLTSHLGSFEALRIHGVLTKKLPLRIVIDRAHSPMLMAMLERLNPRLAADSIDASQRGPELVLAIKQALEGGHLVGLMADRVRAGEAAVTVEFLGRPARLPCAPWILAGTLGVPVHLGFAVYRGGGVYDAYLETLFDHIELPRHSRSQAIAAYAQIYADRLAERTRDAPYNWFNFYDFWAQ